MSVMIDTVQIRHRIPTPSKADLLALGFRKSKRSTLIKEVWIKNQKDKADSMPRLTWSRTAGGDWLSVEVSLPKFLFGRNTVWLSQQEILDALDMLSLFVFENANVDFDARTALVGRVHYFNDFRVGAENVALYLNAAAKAIIPRMQRRIEEHGVKFRNKSREVVLYDKNSDFEKRMSKGKAVEQEKDESSGVIRLEVRTETSDACTRLSDKQGLNRTAQELFTGSSAFQELSNELSNLGLCEQIDFDKRIDKLRDCYGDTATFRRLVCFITLLDRFGENFWSDGIGGYKRTKYFEDLRLVKKADALIYSETSLPPLSLSKNDFIAEELALRSR